MPRKCQKQSSNNNFHVFSPVAEETQQTSLFTLPYDIQRVLHKAQKPRRNKSAFLLFSSEKRALLKSNGENLNSNQMMAKLADLWNNISPEERSRYDMEAVEEKKRYLQELEVFKKENPYAAEVHNKTKKNHIKKPCSAYGIFVKESTVQIKKENPGLLMADVLKIVSQKWKNLCEDEKISFQEKALQEKCLARDMLEQRILEENQSHTESPVKQKKSKQLGEIRKKVKIDTDCFVESTSETYSSQFDLSYGQQEFNEEIYWPQENIDFSGFDFSSNELLPSLSFCTQQESQPTQVSEIQQVATPLPQIQELNLVSMASFVQDDVSFNSAGSQEVHNLLERFNSSMFDSEADLLRGNAFDLMDRIPADSDPFSFNNDMEDFSLTATCSLPSRQRTLSSLLLKALE